MDFNLINPPFRAIGARVRVDTSGDHLAPEAAFRIDVRREQRGETFVIECVPGRMQRIAVLDCNVRRRHLLLMACEKRHDAEKQKYLCGHDERSWFVAAIPEAAAASRVDAAFDALKPDAVRDAELKCGVKRKRRHRRRNEAFVRQGEWFFIPRPNLEFHRLLLLRREPLSRGRGKPHIADECVRRGGQAVYVSFLAPNGLTGPEYQAWRRRDGHRPEFRHVPWRIMRRNPEVFVRGRIRHPDHATVVLDDWHEVFINTEGQARAMKDVAFLD